MKNLSFDKKLQISKRLYNGAVLSFIVFMLIGFFHWANVLVGLSLGVTGCFLFLQGIWGWRERVIFVQRKLPFAKDVFERNDRWIAVILTIVMGIVFMIVGLLLGLQK